MPHNKYYFPIHEMETKGQFVQTTTTTYEIPDNLTKANFFDAGLDLRSAESVEIPAGDRKLIGTGVYLKIPDGCVGLLWSRSGLSYKKGIQVGAGCVDSTYRGEVKVLLFNLSKETQTVEIGDKIAQLLTFPVNLYSYVKVEELDVTERGANGFGSTEEKEKNMKKK